ncbi:MAG TPA: glycosyl hydrolase [Cytophagales bacterium]|mgnify:CR=1 FL=1|nr:glycosyl hydrolase [Cytophagales bacterium]
MCKTGKTLALQVRYLLLFVITAIVFLSCNENNVMSERDRFIDSLMQEMTLEEKLGQLTAFSSGWDVTGPVLNEEYEKDVKAGRCGTLFNAHGVAYVTKLQKMAVEETRLGIPLLFGYDVIHGYKTTFPIPLAESCSWDLELIEKSTSMSAKEAAASGLNWTYNPMVDISRDPRWGRVAEGAGEDQFLGSQIAAAKVRGIQGSSLDDPLTLAACVKHFAAYGAAQAGRDYHTVDMSEIVFKEYYLPPYRAAIEAGAASVMTSFNELFGVPASGSTYLMQDLLRDELGFKGLLVTDYTSINEMVNHGYASDLQHAGELALKAGVDMDLQGSVYLDHLKKSLEEGAITMDQINRSVKRVLEIKYNLGLFEDPFLYLDEDREKDLVMSEEMYEHSFESGKRSIVLLKNEAYNGKELLPLKEPGNIALIGPLGNNDKDILGTWKASGTSSERTTILQGLKSRYPDANIQFAEGCGAIEEDRSGFSEAIQTARNADLVILAIGESAPLSGEASSRTDIGLPGVQEELVKEIQKLNKPIVALVLAGRPLTISHLEESVPAILYTWHLGSRMGDAVAAVLAGDYNPSGKLTMTFPRNVGQIPIHYNMKNTGRPYNPKDSYTTRYLDAPNDPLYPFGFGLSYTSFNYSDLTLSTSSISMDDSLEVSVEVTNSGEMAGEEVVQLYIRDLVGSITRPVKELKGFEKIMLEPGETKTVRFTLSVDDLKFYNGKLDYVAEPGRFKVFIGGSSVDVLEKDFELNM